MQSLKGTAVRQITNMTNHDVSIGGKTIKAKDSSPRLIKKADIKIKNKNTSAFTVKPGKGKRIYRLYDKEWNKKTLTKKRSCIKKGS